MVETVNGMVKRHYPFAEQKGLDLEVFTVQTRALLEEELDDQSFLSEMSRTIATLRDGHTRLERRFLSPGATVPLSWQLVGQSLYVTRVEDPALGIVPGDRIMAVDHRPVAQALAEQSAHHVASATAMAQMRAGEELLSGPKGSRVALLIEGKGVIEVERTLTRPFHLPKPVARRFGDIGYLEIATFGYIDDLDRLDSLVNELMDTRGLIIDLRGNGGGYPSVTDGLFGRLVSQSVPSFDMVDVRGRVHRSLTPAPRGKTYDNPVVVLTDALTFSAANYFAQRIDYHNRGILIGERTGGGAASPERGVTLVPGIWFQVSTLVIRTPHGTNTEEGLEPTLHISLTREDFAQGLASQSGVPELDKVLKAAIDYLEARP